jgi:hypothetical protein
MQPSLDHSFMQSPAWLTLSIHAQGALQGMLQFATRRNCDWVVDGTAKQLGDWIGPELSLAPATIITGLRELDTVGLVRKGRRGSSQSFIVSAPIVER